MGLQKSSIIFFPFKAPSFYWEAELCSLGDPEDQDPGPSISVGFAPSTDQLASGWINPVGSCLLHRFFLLCIVFLFFFVWFYCHFVFLQGTISLRVCSVCSSVSIDSVKATDSDMLVHVTMPVRKNASVTNVSKLICVIGKK